MNPKQQFPLSRRSIFIVLAGLALFTLACAVLSPKKTAPAETPTQVESQSQAETPDSSEPQATSEEPEIVETEQPTQAKPKPIKPGGKATVPAPNQPDETETPIPASGLAGLFKTFPRPAAAKVSNTSVDDRSGNMTIQVNENPAELEAFYQKALTGQGWTERYSEPGWTGGFKQSWKKDDIYLTVEYMFYEAGPAIEVRADQIDEAAALKNLPQDFPVPEGAELTAASSTSFTFDIPKDFEATVALYNQLLSKAGLKSAPGGGMEGSCGGDCGEGFVDMAQQFGLTPIPTLTPDPRKEQSYTVQLKDGSEAVLQFNPHRDHTIVYIDITWKNAERAGLPVEVYPGATIITSDAGMLMFEVSADIKTVIAFYEDSLKKDGWKAGDFSVNTGELYTTNWTKDKQNITVSLAVAGGKVTGVIACTNCK